MVCIIRYLLLTFKNGSLFLQTASVYHEFSTSSAPSMIDFSKIPDHSSQGVYYLIIPYSTLGVYYLSSTSKVSTFYMKIRQTKEEEEEQDDEAISAMLFSLKLFSPLYTLQKSQRHLYIGFFI